MRITFETGWALTRSGTVPGCCRRASGLTRSAASLGGCRTHRPMRAVRNGRRTTVEDEADGPLARPVDRSVRRRRRCPVPEALGSEAGLERVAIITHEVRRSGSIVPAGVAYRAVIPRDLDAPTRTQRSAPFSSVTVPARSQPRGPTDRPAGSRPPRFLCVLAAARGASDRQRGGHRMIGRSSLVHRAGDITFERRCGAPHRAGAPRSGSLHAASKPSDRPPTLNVTVLVDRSTTKSTPAMRPGSTGQRVTPPGCLAGRWPVFPALRAP
jgi:hypothetical protein